MRSISHQDTKLNFNQLPNKKEKQEASEACIQLSSSGNMQMGIEKVVFIINLKLIRLGEIVRNMEVEQSGYRLSRAILSKIPKSAFMLAALIVLALMITNAVLAASSKPKVALTECLAQYYDLTHPKISTFLGVEVARKDQALSSASDINQIIKYLNQSRILEFHSDKTVPLNECQIELNYKPSNNSALLGYLVSNYPLSSVNRTNSEFLQKHGIIVDKIIIPEIDVGYRYVGADLFVSQVEDFMFALNQDFTKFERQFQAKLNQYSKELLSQIKELSSLEDETDRKSPANDSAEVNKKDGGSFQEQKTGVEPIKVEKSNIEAMTKNAKNRLLEDIVLGAEKQENSTNITAEIQQLKSEYIILFNVINSLAQKTTYSRHKIIYSFSSAETEKQWYTVVLPSHLAMSKLPLLWSLLTKLITLCFMAFYIIGCFYLIAIAVRYGFILITLLFTTVGSKCFLAVGWMDRFLGLYKRRDPNGNGVRNSKIIMQIGLSFLGIYLLLTIIGYLLSQAAAAVFKVTQIIPNHPLYSNSLMATFYTIEIFHYLFMRSRISLQFFSKFSLLSTLFLLMIAASYPYFYTSLLLHFLFLLNLLFVFCFLFFEKWVSEEGYESGFKPCLEKPRMLFYLGYDLDWHRGLPPIWTMFQPWFDLGYASQQERCYIDQNYELLYGRLMGVNQSQQIPDDQDESEESEILRRPEMMQNSEGT